MDKVVGDRQINRKPLIPPLSNNNHSNYKTSQSASKTDSNETSNESNIIDYKNILLTMRGEISSDYIYRNSVTQKQPNITFVEDTEDDDEQFILNMKAIIDKNDQMQSKENFSIRDLQSKSYLSRKKKCAFSDEDENLIKRFKRSVDKNNASCAVTQKSQQSEHDVSVSNQGHHDYSTTCTPQSIPVIKYNPNDTYFRCNMNELFFHAASKNDQWPITPNAKTTIVGTEIEIEEIQEMIYHDPHDLTPPEKGDL